RTAPAALRATTSFVRARAGAGERDDMHRLSPKATYVTILGAEGFARGLLFVALVSYWVVQARLNPLQLVLLGTALEGTLFLLQVPTGAFADAIGRRPATVIGYALLGAGLGLQAFTRDFGSLLVLQAISGGAWAFLIGSIEAWIAQQAGTDGLERVFLRGGQAGIAGLMVGLCMTVVAGQVDPRLPIFAGGALLVVVSAMAAVLMTEEPISRSPGSKSPRAGSAWSHSSWRCPASPAESQGPCFQRSTSRGPLSWSALRSSRGCRRRWRPSSAPRRSGASPSR